MVNFNIKLADEIVAVNCIYPSTKLFCQDYLTEQDATFQVIVTQEDILEEHKKSDAQRKREGLPPLVYPDDYLETLALYRKIVDVFLAKDIILFHGSVIAVEGEAFLFTAPSGTGKSTHVRLWREYFKDRAVMVNDDKPLIRLDGDRAKIYGTPWMGKHNLGSNVVYPLKAICHLQRGIENSIENISFKKLYSTIMQQTQRPSQPQGMVRLLSLIDVLGEKVSFYQLYCTISEEAVILAYNTMKGI